MKKKLSKKQTIALVVFAVFCYLGGLELALRLQQRIGPFFDLENPEYLSHISQPNNLLNHVHRREANEKMRFDEHGVRLTAPYPYYKTENKDRLLFIGDSFMAGFEDGAESIPAYMYERFKKTLPQRQLSFLNIACPSYSVVSYALQSKYLLDILRPKYLVINVDESDLSGDYRAQSQVIRDYSGKMVAQMASFKSDLVERMGKEMRDQPLYLQRLVTRLLTTQLLFPRLEAIYGQEPLDKFYLFSQLSAEEARKRHPDMIEVFRGDLEELAANIKAAKFPPTKVVFSMHAHLQHIVPQQGKVWNRVIAETVGEVAKKNGFLFYDSLSHLKTAFGSNPQDYYIPNDMHLNPEGLKVYANLLGAFLEENFFGHNNVGRQLSSK